LLDCATIQQVLDEVWPLEEKVRRLDEMVEQRLVEAARDLTSMAVLEWNWPER
jgi:uncharacterized protein with PhoU and TrkA domain